MCLFSKPAAAVKRSALKRSANCTWGFGEKWNRTTSSHAEGGIGSISCVAWIMKSLIKIWIFMLVILFGR